MMVDWGEVLQGGLGDFAGGLLVTVLFFIVDSVRSSRSELKRRTRHLHAAKQELNRLEEVGREAGLNPDNFMGEPHTSLLSLIVLELVADADVNNLGDHLSKIQYSADLLRYQRQLLHSEIFGTGGALRGNEEKIVNLRESIKNSARQLNSRCTRLQDVLNRQLVKQKN